MSKTTCAFLQVVMAKRKATPFEFQERKRRWQGPWPFQVHTKFGVEEDEWLMQEYVWEVLRANRITTATLPMLNELTMDGKKQNISMPKAKEDLFDAQDKCTEFDYELVIGWMGEIARNLRHVHEVAGVAHLDIKPENILRMPNGGLRIADWGLATHGASLPITDENLYWGTPPYNYYRSANDTGITTDMYAAGVTFYVLCVGRFPSPELHDKHGQDLVAAIVSKFHTGKYSKDFDTIEDDKKQRLASCIGSLLEPNPNNRKWVI